MEELMLLMPTDALFRTDRIKQIAGTIILCILFVVATSEAGNPEYMKLDYGEVPAVEIKGYWDTSGVFIATDIEELPKPRRPKLRGDIQAVDLRNTEITMYGIPIKIDDETQFTDAEKGISAIEDLKAGQRIEVSCKINTEKQWEARKIKASDIKESDKIKGSVTRAAVDGNPPDTLEIHGLLILLITETDVNEPGSFFEEIEFDELAYSGADENSHGITLGNNFHFNADYRQTVRSEKEYDLSEFLSADHNDIEPQIRLELTGYLNNNLRAFFQIRMRKQYAFESDRETSQSRELDAGDTQLFLFARDVGVKGLTFKIGRQDMEETREWLFDEYLDAVRVYYYGREHLVLETALMHAVAELNSKFETWTDFFGQVRWYFDKHSRLRSYVLLRKDSDEARNREPVWWGIGYDGRVHRRVRTWMEFAIMRGTDKGEDLRASALDLGTTIIPFSHRLSPFLTFAYALGSGDETGGDGIDNDFRQTGYEDNVDNFGGVSSVRYYGEVLDPELSNLKILTLGLGFRPFRHSSIEAVYHSYKQHHPDDKLRGDLIDPPARPSGMTDDIGWELDILLGVTRIWERISLSLVVAIFSPHQAFAPRLEKAVLNRLNLKIDL
jgi:alginate production protein